jgi:hypothetical protein
VGIKASGIHDFHVTLQKPKFVLNAADECFAETLFVGMALVCGAPVFTDK